MNPNPNCPDCQGKGTRSRFNGAFCPCLWDTGVTLQISDREVFAKRARELGEVRVTRVPSTVLTKQEGTYVWTPSVDVLYTLTPESTDTAKGTWYFKEVVPSGSEGVVDLSSCLYVQLEASEVKILFQRRSGCF